MFSRISKSLAPLVIVSAALVSTPAAMADEATWIPDTIRASDSNRSEAWNLVENLIDVLFLTVAV